MASNVNYFEAYLTPSFNYQFLKEVGKEVVIHVAHQSEGINFANPQKQAQNIESLRVALKAADYFDSKIIIFHPGYLEDEHCSEANALKFIKENYDPRLCVENMPISASYFDFLCANPIETRRFIKKTKVGFCFDFAHAFESNEFRPIDNFIEKYLALGPQIFHLTDTDLLEIKKKKPQKESHLSLGDGTLDIKSIIKNIPRGSLLTLETPTISAIQTKEIELIRQILR